MKTTKSTTTNPQLQVSDLRLKLQTIRLEIKAGKQTNTNAHKKLKKELAQLLTKLKQK